MIVDIPDDGGRRMGDVRSGGMGVGESDDPAWDVSDGTEREERRVRMGSFSNENDDAGFGGIGGEGGKVVEVIEDVAKFDKEKLGRAMDFLE